MRYFSMKAKGNKGEILLYQDIGKPSMFSQDSTSAEAFAKELKGLGNVSTIDCRINSPGGNVFEGVTIYNLLAKHPARVTVHIDGIAASIASVIAMAGDEINIADNGTMMIHDAQGGAFGPSDLLRRTADVMDQITGTIAATYAKRSGADEKKIRSLMTDETWMTAAEAKQYGLVDNVVDNMSISACVFDPSRFAHTPPEVIARMNERPLRERFTARFQQIETDRIRERVAART